MYFVFKMVKIFTIFVFEKTSNYENFNDIM